MFEFSIFGVLVRVHLWFWLSMILLGELITHGLSHGGADGVIKIMLFLVLAFVSLLIHELGHALVGRKLTGSQPIINLQAFGGNAQFFNTSFSRKQHILMVAAGPATNIVLSVLGYLGTLALGVYYPEKLDTPIFEFVYLMFVLNLFWFIFNIIPVFPLDGGQIVHSLIKSPATAHKVSLVVAILMAIVSVKLGGMFVTVFFAFMAYQNYTILQQIKGWRK